MKIHVLYFAVVRERVGREDQWLTLPTGATVADVRAELLRCQPSLAALLPHCRIAVDEAFAADDHVVSEGAEVALIPPVAGGQDIARPLRHIVLLDTPLSLERCMAATKAGGHGAQAVFIGTVRDFSQGRVVTHLEYQAYPSMALAVMRRLADEVCAQWPGTTLAAEHRLGSLAIGDAAVVIVAAAAHREQAFAACREYLERLKREVPIWKKEFAPDGHSWVGLGP